VEAALAIRMQPRLPVSSILGSILRNVPLETELPSFIERRLTDAVAASNRATVAVPCSAAKASPQGCGAARSHVPSSRLRGQPARLGALHGHGTQSVQARLEGSHTVACLLVGDDAFFATVSHCGR
jgi:hypothetical protein